MKSRFNKGFTLIELLVVVAIIGILSSIVLVSLNSARNKGKDASAKGSMSSARASAELYFDTWNDYGNSVSASLDPATNLSITASSSICDNGDMTNLGVAVLKQTNTHVHCNVIAAPASYTLDVLMNDGRTYCVDSTGYAGYITGTAPAASGASCL